MKMISKIANVALGLVFVGSSVFAQSLDDAKKAIDAEQYQKAKSMLKNLTVTQATKDENFFYLGWVYLIQDYPDSAKEQFTKALAVNPKSALGYVGLGAVAHYNKDAAGTTSNFNSATQNSGKKDWLPYLYMGKAYELLSPGAKTLSPEDYNAALAALNKGDANAQQKSAEVQSAIGDAHRTQLGQATPAYTAYTAALALNPKYLPASVGLGVILENAQNFEDAEGAFKNAIALDPNFGPAYREWAETDLYWAKTVRRTNPTLTQSKIKEAVEHYQKFLSLTDRSTESLLRYALFLYNAGDFTTLQSVASELAKSVNANALVYRYIGYAGYQNKEYAKGLKAMQTWFQKATPERIIPSDYLELGHLQIATGDTVGGVASLKKYATLDTTQVEDMYFEIVQIYSKSRSNLPALVKTYQEEISKIHNRPLLNEHLRLGLALYNYFKIQAKAAKANPANPKADSSLLVQADSALSYVQRNNPNKIVATPRYRALINDEKDTDIGNLKGYAKPYWDEVIAMVTAKADKATDQEKGYMAEAYDFEGNYSLYHDKDVAKAEEWYNKAIALDPTSYYAKNYFANKKIQEENDAAIKAAAEKKKNAPATKKPSGQK